MTQTQTHVHIGIGVSDIAQAVAFYSVLFDAEPAKVKPGYAKFQLAEPALNFSLNLTDRPGPAPEPAHFGLQVGTQGDVLRARLRLEEAGLATLVQNQTTCCYALQDKVWVSDPDGHKWEVFVTHADTEVAGDASSKECCPGSASDSDSVPAAASA